MSQTSKDLVEQRLMYWIERLEAQVEELLRNVSCEDLPPKERFSLAVRCLALLQRFLLLTQKSDPITQSNDAQRVLDSLRAHMRGEWPMEGEENEKGASPYEHRHSDS